jgi:hypothetical protein
MKREIWRQPVTLPDTICKKDKNNLFPIIIRYNQFGNRFVNLWKNIINENAMFSDGRILAAYCKNKNINNYLVRSRLINKSTNINAINNKLDITYAFRTCASNKCKTCTLHSCNKINFESSTNKSSFRFREDIYCNTANIIYLITCRQCKIQYIGETGRTLRDRIVDHRSAIKLRKRTPTAIHFNSSEHSVLDLQAIAIEKVTDTPLAIYTRKQREEFWQNKLNTKFPSGLNCMLTD